MTKKKIEFKIPGCYIEANFEQYKNGNWKFSVTNPSNKNKQIVERSMNTELVKETIAMMMGQEFRQNYKDNIQILKKSILNWKKLHNLIIKKKKND